MYFKNNLYMIIHHTYLYLISVLYTPSLLYTMFIIITIIIIIITIIITIIIIIVFHSYTQFMVSWFWDLLIESGPWGSLGYTESKVPKTTGTQTTYLPLPRHSMYGIFTYIWVFLGVNVGKYTIH